MIKREAYQVKVRYNTVPYICIMQINNQDDVSEGERHEKGIQLRTCLKTNQKVSACVFVLKNEGP
jgi:hypothetical protein